MTSTRLNAYRNGVKFRAVGLNPWHGKSSYSSGDSSFVTWQHREVAVNGLHCNHYHNVILLLAARTVVVAAGGYFC